MSAFRDFLEQSVFYSKETPSNLANIINSLSYPENLTEDIKLGQIEVDNGVTLAIAKENLPEKGRAVNSLGVFYEYDIAWGSTTDPSYNASVAGEYVLTGTISNLPSFITNTDTKGVKVTIVVGSAPPSVETKLEITGDGFVVDNEEFTITVPASTTVGGLKNAVSATDSSEQTYRVINKEDVDELVTEDIFEVTAEDGETVKEYTITVTAPPSVETKLEITGDGFVVDNEEFTITVPASTTVGGLKNAVSATDSSEQTYRVINKEDVDELVTEDIFEVTAEDGETVKEYTITVTA